MVREKLKKHVSESMKQVLDPIQVLGYFPSWFFCNVPQFLQLDAFFIEYSGFFTNNVSLEERCSRWTTFPYFFANGELYCGTRHNPNYVNGIKENEECEFAICQITRLFVLKSWKEMIVGQGRSSVSDFVKDSKLLYRR